MDPYIHDLFRNTFERDPSPSAEIEDGLSVLLAFPPCSKVEDERVQNHGFSPSAETHSTNEIVR